MREQYRSSKIKNKKITKKKKKSFDGGGPLKGYVAS